MHKEFELFLNDSKLEFFVNLGKCDWKLLVFSILYDVHMLFEPSLFDNPALEPFLRDFFLKFSGNGQWLTHKEFLTFMKKSNKGHGLVLIQRWTEERMEQ